MDQLSSLFGLCQQPSNQQQQQQQQQQPSPSTNDNVKVHIFTDESAVAFVTPSSTLAYTNTTTPSTTPPPPPPPTTSKITTIFGSKTINKSPTSLPASINWDLTTYRNEIYPGDLSTSSTLPCNSTTTTTTPSTPSIKLTSKSCKLSSTKRPKSNLHINTATGTSIFVKPILKSSSSLLSNNYSSHHKRCSSLGQSIRYIDDEPTPTTPSAHFSFSPHYHHHHQRPSGSPLASLTCPSTPNAYTTNVPVQSAFPAFTGMHLSTSTTPDQQQHQPSPPPSAIINGRCVNCGLSFNQLNDSNNENNLNVGQQTISTQTDSSYDQLWTCQQSLNTGFAPSPSPSPPPPPPTTITTGSSSGLLDPSLCDHLLHLNHQSPRYNHNQHSSHFHHNQGRSTNNLDSNVSLLPPLASVESVAQQLNSTTDPTTNNTNNPTSHQHSNLHNKSFRSYHQPHHHLHHHHNHSHHHEATDRQSLYSIHMEKDFRYFFQHPYARLLVAYSVIACNFLIFAEDPISHSHTECGLPIVGNVVSFVFTRYPPETLWKVVKIICWLTAIIVGMVTGKYLVHHVLLRRMLRLKMFRDEEGTWMIMILVTFICTYLFSLVYNLILLSGHPNPTPYLITTLMGVTNSSFMKAAACGTWLGDFFTAWMVTDMMLQDELYPGWAKGLRSFLMRNGHIRIIIFWTGSIGVSSLVIYMISSDEISWDNLNHNYVNTTELTRAFLASMILVMDLLVVMQDWDFPHFVCDMDIKLPGLKQASYSFKIFTIKKTLSLPETFVFHITGKWFNYGIIIVVMMLDLNMWKNQIIYYPPDFGQYTGPDYKVYTVADESILSTGNSSLWTYSVRASTISKLTNRSLMESDLVVNSRYLNYSIYVKSLAFLPCAAGFVLFFTLIYQYGRFPPKTDASYGGRLKKRKSTSSWRRERRDSRHGYISWKGITTYQEEATAFHRQSQENSNV